MSEEINESRRNISILAPKTGSEEITAKQGRLPLAEQGVTDTAVNIRNKVARGGFSAAFFLQCLVALGAQTVRLDD